MTPLLRKAKLMKTNKASTAPRYYDNYDRAANAVSNNSGKGGSSANSTFRPLDSQDDSAHFFRDTTYGASAKGSRTPPNLRHEPEEGNIYAMTDIQVETHHTNKR